VACRLTIESLLVRQSAGDTLAGNSTDPGTDLLNRDHQWIVGETRSTANSGANVSARPRWDSVSVLGAARVGLSQRSEHRHYSIARKFAAMRARIADERSNEL